MSNEKKSLSRVIWENLQLLVLMLTVAGQIFVGIAFFIGQGLWLVANIIAVARNFVLHRPIADLVKDGTMLAITATLIVARALGIY